MASYELNELTFASPEKPRDFNSGDGTTHTTTSTVEVEEYLQKLASWQLALTVAAARPNNHQLLNCDHQPTEHHMISRGGSHYGTLIGQCRHPVQPEKTDWFT